MRMHLLFLLSLGSILCYGDDSGPKPASGSLIYQKGYGVWTIEALGHVVVKDKSKMLAPRWGLKRPSLENFPSLEKLSPLVQKPISISEIVVKDMGRVVIEEGIANKITVTAEDAISSEVEIDLSSNTGVLTCQLRSNRRYVFNTADPAGFEVRITLLPDILSKIKRFYAQGSTELKVKLQSKKDSEAVKGGKVAVCAADWSRVQIENISAQDTSIQVQGFASLDLDHVSVTGTCVLENYGGKHMRVGELRAQRARVMATHSGKIVIESGKVGMLEIEARDEGAVYADAVFCEKEPVVAASPAVIVYINKKKYEKRAES